MYAYMFVDQCNQDIVEMFLKMLRTRVQKTSLRYDKQEMLYWQKQSEQKQSEQKQTMFYDKQKPIPRRQCQQKEKMEC